MTRRYTPGMRSEPLSEEERQQMAAVTDQAMFVSTMLEQSSACLGDAVRGIGVLRMMTDDQDVGMAYDKLSAFLANTHSELFVAKGAFIQVMATGKDEL